MSPALIAGEWSCSEIHGSSSSPERRIHAAVYGVALSEDWRTVRLAEGLLAHHPKWEHAASHFSVTSHVDMSPLANKKCVKGVVDHEMLKVHPPVGPHGVP